MSNDTTTVRVARSDADRIRNHIKRLSITGNGRYATDDIVNIALDAYEKIIKTNDKSSDCVENLLANSDV